MNDCFVVLRGKKELVLVEASVVVGRNCRREARDPREIGQQSTKLKLKCGL